VGPVTTDVGKPKMVARNAESGGAPKAAALKVADPPKAPPGCQ